MTPKSQKCRRTIRKMSPDSTMLHSNVSCQIWGFVDGLTELVILMITKLMITSGNLRLGTVYGIPIQSVQKKKSFLSRNKVSRLQISATASWLGGNLFKKTNRGEKMITVRKKPYQKIRKWSWKFSRSKIEIFPDRKILRSKILKFFCWNY